MLSTAPAEEKLDPRVKRTRSLIQQAFQELLAEKNFAAISVQEITERAEINRATFYAHFPDKFALLKESIRQIFRAELEKRTLSACHYSEENLLALIVTVCEFTAQTGKNCKSSDSQFEALVEAEVKLQIQELLELWLTQPVPAQEPGIASTASGWAIYGLALRWSRAKNRLPAENYAREILPLLTQLMYSVETM